MRLLLLDIETYCELDLTKVGVYRYAADPSFRVLLVGFTYLDGDIHVTETVSHSLDQQVLEDLTDPQVLKIAHNANFERTCLSRYLGLSMDPSQWCDTMAAAAAFGLPRSLADLSAFLNLGVVKDPRGKNLIHRFSKPVRGKRILPCDDPVAWAEFIEYCRRDVETEVQLWRALPVSTDTERDMWILDQHINDRGVRVDLPLAQACMQADETIRSHNIELMRTLTGCDNPNSGQQLMVWLNSQGVQLPNLLAATVDQALAGSSLPIDVRQLLTARRSMNTASAKKYSTILNSVVGERVHGLFQYYGAHTGRFAGRLVQFQNLPRGSLTGETLQVERRRVLNGGDTDAEGLKSLVRPTFIPSEGMWFYVSDFSAIEARVLAWLAGEQWVLEAFAAGEDIYKVTASRMLHVPVDRVTKEHRQQGKAAVLACGYQGGVGAIERIAPGVMTPTEMQSTVNLYRQANPRIVQFWSTIERSVRAAWRTKQPVEIGALTIRCFKPHPPVYHGVCLAITLPSGRDLTYHHVNVTASSICFTEGPGRVDTYGGKLTENVVQAVARDLLVEAMLNLNLVGFDIVAHVHDEVVIEAPTTIDPEIISMVMSTPPPWAAGLPLSASLDTWEFYQK